MAEQITVPLQILKIDAEQRLATGWIAVVTAEDGTPIIDRDGHIIPVVELEKAVHAAFSGSSGKGKAGDLHETPAVADFVESFVVTAEKRAALGLGEGPEGWIATLRVNNEDVWTKIKNGERPELSMHGTGEGVVL